MARITIEDCTEKVPNRFQLVQMTAIRAKQLKKGATPLVSGDDNKAVVTALREIAAGHVTPDYSQPDEELAPVTDALPDLGMADGSVATPDGDAQPAPVGEDVPTADDLPEPPEETIE